MKSDAYYIAELEDRILEVVFNQTKDIPRPWGLILSGGFDSGLLAAITKPDYVYSIGFPYGPKYDESIYRDAIVKHLKLENKIKVINFLQEDFMPNLQQGVHIMGEPTSHFSLAPLNLLMKEIKARTNGHQIHVLSGEGPDEYLGGYARQIIFDELNKLHEIPELRNYRKMIPKALGFENLILQYGRMMGYPEKEISRYMMIPNTPLQGVIGKMDMELGVIEIMEQKLAIAHGVNLHYPYIDTLFAEYCYKLPDHLKIRNGVTKYIFRKIAMKYLPSIMEDRIKMGGPVAPVGLWINDRDKGNEFDKTEYLELQRKILDETN